ncbi:MAG: hypothetical protein V3T05_03915 [Myxococcota bacterium]
MLTAGGGFRPSTVWLATCVAVASPAVAAEEAETSGESTRTRLVLGSTATTRSAGELGWQISNIMMHEIQYGLTDDLQIGMRTAVPAVYVAAFPTLTWGTDLSDTLRFGAELTAGALWPYMTVKEIEAVFTGRAVVAGGGPALTWVSGDLTLNVGVPVYFARYGHKEFRTQIVDSSPMTISRIEFSNYVVALPHAGAVYRVSDGLRLHAEALYPLGNVDNVGRVAVFFYGLRVVVDRAYVDLTFALPVYPGALSLYKLLPAGVPLVAFGVMFGDESAPQLDRNSDRIPRWGTEPT